jgi:hypothetical protein
MPDLDRRISAIELKSEGAREWRKAGWAARARMEEQWALA